MSGFDLPPGLKGDESAETLRRIQSEIQKERNARRGASNLLEGAGSGEEQIRQAQTTGFVGDSSKHIDSAVTGILTAADIAGKFAGGAIDSVTDFAAGAYNLGKEGIAYAVQGLAPELAERIRQPLHPIPTRSLVARGGAAVADPLRALRALGGDPKATQSLVEDAGRIESESQAIIEGRQRREGGEGLVEGAKVAGEVAGMAGHTAGFMVGPSGQFAGMVQKYVGGKVGARVGAALEKSLQDPGVGRALAVSAGEIAGAAAGFGAEAFVRGGPSGRIDEAKAGALIGPVVLAVGRLANATESGAGKLLKRYFDGQERWSPQVAGAIAGLVEGPALAASGGMNIIDVEFWRDGIGAAWNGDSEAFNAWLIHAAGTTAATVMMRGGRAGFGQQWARMNPREATVERTKAFDRAVKEDAEAKTEAIAKGKEGVEPKEISAADKKSLARQGVEEASRQGWVPGLDKAKGETTLRMPGVKGRIRLRRENNQDEIEIPRQLFRRLFPEDRAADRTEDLIVRGETAVRAVLDAISARSGISHSESRRTFAPRGFVEETPGIWVSPSGQRFTRRFGETLAQKTETEAWKGGKRIARDKTWFKVPEAEAAQPRNQINDDFVPIAQLLAPTIKTLGEAADPTAQLIARTLDHLSSEMLLSAGKHDPVAIEAMKFWSSAPPHQLLASGNAPVMAKLLREAAAVQGGTVTAEAAINNLRSLPKELATEQAAVERAFSAGEEGAALTPTPTLAERQAQFRAIPEGKGKDLAAQRGAVVQAYAKDLIKARKDKGEGEVKARELTEAFGITAPTARKYLQAAYGETLTFKGTMQAFAGAMASGEMIQAGRIILNGSIDITQKAFRLAAQDLVRGVRSDGGEVGKVIAEKAEQALTFTRQAEGKLDKFTKEALKLSQKIRARKSLNELEDLTWTHDGEANYAVDRFTDLVEGRIKTKDPITKQLVDAYRETVYQIGKLHEDAGLQIQLKDGSWVPFTAKRDRLRRLRHHTPETIDIIRKGGDGLVDLARAYAHLNKMPLDLTIKRLRESIDPQLIRRDPAEHQRVFERAPAAIISGGVAVPVLETSYYSSMRRMVEMGSARYGFVKAFGQDTAGREKGETMTIVKEYAEANGDPQRVVNLVNALNRLPIEKPIFDPGSPAGMLLRHGWQPLNTLLRMVRLSRAFTPNIPEPLGSILPYMGLRRMVLSFADIIQHPRGLWESLVEQGAITRDIAHLRLERGRFLHGLARNIGLPFHALTKIVNEWNDMWSGAAALRLVKDLKAGKPHLLDGDVLRLMDFRKADIDAMLKGKGTEDNYKRILTKASSFLQFATAQPAEKSRLQHSRVFQANFAFQQYAQGKIRRVGEAVDNIRTAKTPAERYKATALFSKLMIGSAVSGATSLYLNWLLFYSLPMELMGEDDDSGGVVAQAGGWGQFFQESAHYALWGGMFDAIRRGLMEENEAGIGTHIFEHTISGSVLTHIVQMANDTGPYRNMGSEDKILFLLPKDKILKFLSSNIPIAAPARRYLAAYGLAEGDPKLEAAMSNYYTWRRKNAPMSFDKGASDDKFLTAMKKLGTKLRRGVPPTSDELITLIGDAIGERGARSTAASLRFRRIMQGKDWASLTEAQQNDLRTVLGETGWSAIEGYDKLLTTLADAVSESGAMRDLDPFLEKVEAAAPAQKTKLWTGFVNDELGTAVKSAARAKSFSQLVDRVGELAEVLEQHRGDLDPEEFPAGRGVRGVLLRKASKGYKAQRRKNIRDQSGR